MKINKELKKINGLIVFLLIKIKDLINMFFYNTDTFIKIFGKFFYLDCIIMNL